MRLFQSNFLEPLTKVPPWIPITVWTPILGIQFYLQINSNHSFFFNSILLFIGLLFWSLFEYGLHRFVFHAHFKHPLGKRLVFLIHENHHIVPNDRLRGLMPIVPAFIIGGGLRGFLSLALPSAYVSPLFSGLILGYLIYDYFHFSFHHYNFKYEWWRRLRRNHRIHHYDEQIRFGVSNPLWDYLFQSFERGSHEISNHHEA